MALVPRKTKAGVVFWVVNYRGKQQLWERSGLVKRDAERRDVSMKKEIADGVYAAKPTGAVTVDSFATSWFKERNIRSVDDEKSLYENHVRKRCPWYANLKVEDARPRHTLQLVKEIRAPYQGRYGDREELSEKSIALVVGVLTTMFKHARLRELTSWNPCELPKGTINRKSKTKRFPYEVAELTKLANHPEIDWDVRTWLLLAFLTGMREGEVCGRRWHHLDRGPGPLWCLTVDTQYDDQPLKTDNPRAVPVHPALATTLDAWWSGGFEAVYRRKPKPNDFIVPRQDADHANLTRSMAYKRFHLACQTAEVTPHTVHSTRHTFISLARRGGARKDVLERITHNATGDVVDSYTKFDWAPLCEAVMCLPDISASIRRTA